MKPALLLIPFLTLATATGVAVKVKSTPEKSQVMNITSNSLAGNITDTLKAETNQYVAVNKSILKVSPNKERVVYLTTEVTPDSAQTLTDQLKALETESSDPIWLLINSPGGSVIDGGTVISQMEASKAPIYTVCTYLCASMAAMIHSYGTKRYALDRALLMYHPASGAAEGQALNMLSMLNTLNRYVDKMVSNVVKRSHVSKSDYDALSAYGLWIDSEDALQKGLVDGIVNLNVPSMPQMAPPLSGKIKEQTVQHPMVITPNVKLFKFDLK